jgi:hypothetical protein
LESVGIDVRWCWEERNDPKRGLPDACRLMLVATDCNSHTLSGAALSLARTNGLPVVHISHRWAQAAPVLARAGFRATSAPEPEPTPLPEPEPVEEPAMIAPPTTTDTPAPPPAPSPRVAALTATNRARYATVLRMLAADPWLTTPDVARLTGLNPSVLWPVLAAARDTLSIHASQGSGRATIENRATYEAWCRTLNVTPCPQNVGPTRPPNSAAQKKAPTPPAAPVSAPAAPPAPVTATPPVDPEAVPVDLRDAVSILRATMADHGFASVTVTETGEVRWERRITRTGMFTL